MTIRSFFKCKNNNNALTLSFLLGEVSLRAVDPFPRLTRSFSGTALTDRAVFSISAKKVPIS